MLTTAFGYMKKLLLYSTLMKQSLLAHREHEPVGALASHIDFSEDAELSISMSSREALL